MTHDLVRDMGYAKNAAPDGWRDHTFRREWEIGLPRRLLWDWLNDPRTFTHGQIWPWRVEFVSEPDGPRGMSPGVLNSHHGPLMSFTGVVGDVIPPARDDRPRLPRPSIPLRQLRRLPPTGPPDPFAVLARRP